MAFSPRLAASSLAMARLAAASSCSLAKGTGLVFVSSERTNNITVVDPRTSKVVKDLRTSRRPRDKHFNADHTRLCSGFGDDITITGLKSRKASVSLPVGRIPWGIVIDD